VSAESEAEDPASAGEQEGADASFEALLRRVAHVSQPAPRSAAMLASGTQLAGGRLSIAGKLGEGGMGVVYAAYDAQRKARVALKTLSRLDAASVYRLKNEFRALADVTHPNLVRLHELFAEDSLWFFTMELIAGQRFDAWVRPDGALDPARLRAALPQLVGAMSAIHGAGKLHRDLKPSNVLVDGEGRVAVLDFGLAVDPELGGVGQTVLDQSVSGTPAYMAPEQAAGRPATAASDLYALGVMLFEALTGELPFAGRAGEMLAAKQTREAPRASALAAGLPDDLAQLCAALLARDPEARPSIAAVRARLGADAAPVAAAGARAAVAQRGAPPAQRPSDGEPPAAELLGREPELAVLDQAFGAARDGQPVVLFVAGESGMGKSALCMHFLHALRAQGRARVLSGRCYERENVPFKGFDALVDDLSRHLRKLPAAEAAAVLPREVFALARVFPVLDRVAAVADAPKKQVADPQDLKRRAFDAFGELLARMRDRAPLVVLLDDAQWLDQDSVRFLRALLVQPEPVPALLVCVHRSEGAADNALLQAVAQGARDNPKLDVRSLHVGPLPHAALRVLAQRSLPEAVAAASADALAAEAQGSPFFAAELARAAALRPRGAAPPSLSEAVALHVGALPEDARRFLSLLALAGQPLPVDAAIDAAGIADGHASLDRLRGEQLVRVSIDAAGARSVECYHDKIREHVAGALDPRHARALALSLARVLAALPAANAELTARMLDVAELPEEAAVHAARAAEAAFAASAFERSAQLYARAIERGRFEPERLQALRVARAHALAHAGRSQAGDAYLEAAAHASPADALEFERKAGEHFLLRGDLGRGRALLDRALRSVGHPLPRSLPAALAGVVASRARLRLRGFGFVARATRDARAQRELELLRMAVHCLVRSDYLRAADFSARSVRRALDAGDAVEAARALAWEFLFQSFLGATDAQIEATRALCAALCERTGDRLAQSWLAYCRGIDLAVRRLQPADAITEFDRMLAMMSTESFSTAVYDRAWAHHWRAICMWQLGRFTEAGELAGAHLEDALVRGDHTAAAVLTQTYCWGLLAGDRIEQIERLVQEARARLRADEITTPDTQWLATRLTASVYAGRAAEVWRETAEYRERYFKSFLGRNVVVEAMSLLAAGTAAEAALTSSDPEQRRALQREARRFLRRAAKGASPGPVVIPSAVLLACLDGDRERAVAALRESVPHATIYPVIRHFRRRRLGELLGGDEGAALIADADAFLRAGGVVDPARYTAAFAAGVVLQTSG
jgi:tRNA A-37 threonylcarbamoyl transferase component Bud32